MLPLAIYEDAGASRSEDSYRKSHIDVSGTPAYQDTSTVQKALQTEDKNLILAARKSPETLLMLRGDEWLKLKP